MPRSLVAILLLSFVSAASASIELGAERAVTQPPGVDAAGAPMIASNGSGFLAAWSGGNAAYVQPIAFNGQRLREQAIPITVVESRTVLCDVATDGRDYLIASASPSGVTLTAVAADGTPIGKQTFAAATEPAYAQARLAWDGRRYLLVYYLNTPGAVQGVFVDASTRPLGDPFVIEAKRTFAHIDVASNGDNFVVAGTSDDLCEGNSCRNSLFTTVVSASGSLTSRYQIPVAALPYMIGDSVVYTGSTYVLLWTDALGNTTSVNTAPLDASGVPSRPASVIATSDQPYRMQAAGVTRTSSGAVAFVLDGPTVAGVTLGRDGTPAETQPLFDTRRDGTSPFTFDAAAAGASTFAVWAFYTPATTAMAGGLAQPSGLTKGGPLAQTTASESVLALATAGARQLVVTSDADGIGAQRVLDGSRSGERLLLAASTGAATVASDGRDFLVVWSTTEGVSDQVIKARVISADGASVVLELSRGRAARVPNTIWTGEHYLVMWEHPVTDGGDQYLWAVRISREGRLLDPAPREIRADVPNAGAPHLVRTRDGLLLLFNAGPTTFYRYNFPIVQSNVYAARVSAAGELLSPSLRLTGDGNLDSISAAAADDLGNVGFAWVSGPIDYHYGPPRQFFSLLRSDSTVSPGILLSNYGGPADVAWSAGRFMTVYASDGVHLARFTAFGAEIDRTRVAVAGSGPHISSFFLAYAAPVPALSGGDNPRAVVRAVSEHVKRRAVR